jgi:glutathione S-transferase
MKLYTFPQAPSPRRVHLLLAEKGLELDQQFVDMARGEHLSDDIARLNPDCTLPILELDDGTCLSSCAAIGRYIEELHPEPALFGASAEEKARIDDRDRWVEMNGMLAVMEAFRNAVKGMKDHALPGPRPVPQIPELAERGRQRFAWFLEDLDRGLDDGGHVAGERFSVADITALVTIDFGLRATRSELPESHARLRDWHRRVSARPAVVDAESTTR